MTSSDHLYNLRTYSVSIFIFDLPCRIELCFFVLCLYMYIHMIDETNCIVTRILYNLVGGFKHLLFSILYMLWNNPSH